MKIRTDFVTNSSSSSYVTVRITTKSGREYEAGYYSGDQGFDVIGSALELSDTYFEKIESGEEILNTALEWFNKTFKHAKEFDFSDGKIAEIKALKKDDMYKVYLRSEINCDDYVISGRTVKYTYTEKLTKEDGEFYFDDFGSEAVCVKIKPNPEASTVTVPESFNGKPVTSLGKDCFESNSTVKKIILPDGIKNPKKEAIKGCKKLERVLYAGDVENDGDVVKIERKTLKSVLTADKTFTVPEGVTAIGKSAFALSQNLNTVVLPKGKIKLGKNSFADCTKLKKIVLDSETVINDILCFEAAKIKTIEFTDGRVISVCNRNFYRCLGFEGEKLIFDYAKATDVILEGEDSPSAIKLAAEILINQSKYLTDDQISKLAYYTIFSCTAAGNIKTVEEICGCNTDLKLTVQNYEHLIKTANGCCQNEIVALLQEKSVSAPKFNEPESIAKQETKGEQKPVSADTAKLWKYKKREDGTLILTGYKGIETKITLPDKIDGISVTAVGEYALPKTIKKNVEEIVVPDSITEIECGETRSSIFSEAKKLKKVILSQNLKEIHNVTFAGCTSLESIEIPESVTEIGPYAFERCSSLTNITFPKGIKFIAEGVLADCEKLTDVKISYGVTKIYDYAFMYDSNLRSVIIPDSVTEIEKRAFTSRYYLTIYSTTGSYAEKFAKENGIKFEAI